MRSRFGLLSFEQRVLELCRNAYLDKLVRTLMLAVFHNWLGDIQMLPEALVDYPKGGKAFSPSIHVFVIRATSIPILYTK